MWREPPAWTRENLSASRSEFLEAYRKEAARTPTVTVKFSERAKPKAHITREMFDNWWHARNRPLEAELRVIIRMFGHVDQKAEQEIWDAWNAGNLKAKGRSNDRGRASAVPGDGVRQRFEARPMSVPRTLSPIVDLTVGLTAEDPTRLGHDELAVTVSLNWGFDDEQNVNCRLRLTEYHLWGCPVLC